MAYGKIEVYEDGMCEVDLFVQDAEGTRITDTCVGWPRAPAGGLAGGEGVGGAMPAGSLPMLASCLPTHPLVPPCRPLAAPCRSELLQELVERVRMAVALPVRIDIKDAYDASCTELTITANIGGWGTWGACTARGRHACAVSSPLAAARGAAGLEAAACVLRRACLCVLLDPARCCCAPAACRALQTAAGVGGRA